MDIQVSGHQVDVGEAFKTHVETQLTGITEKYASRAVSAGVTLGKGRQGFGFHVDVQVSLPTGILMKAEGEAGDAHAALDIAGDRIEKQLRRYKRRLRNHHQNGRPTAEQIAAAYTIFQDRMNGAAEDDDEGTEEGEDAPVTVAERQVDIPEASVSDAVMLMDLRNTPALMFRNAKSGQFNMVYRREDGNIGWVEPSQK